MPSSSRSSLPSLTPSTSAHMTSRSENSQASLKNFGCIAVHFRQNSFLKNSTRVDLLSAATATVSCHWSSVLTGAIIAPSVSIVTSKAAARRARRGALARSPPSVLLSAQDVAPSSQGRSAQVSPRFRRTGVANALVPRAIPSPTTSDRQADTCLRHILTATLRSQERPPK
jgi:hypothetical protein